ncbi:MAG: LPS assembly lipoprotein LptE [Desulfobacterales bacterium]
MKVGCRISNKVPMLHALCPLRGEEAYWLIKSKIIFVALLIGVLFSACGYRFAEQGGFPGDTERLFVKVLENKTQETGVESIVTNALLSELTLRKTDELANGFDDADVVLSGVVNLVTITTISVSKPDVADERRVTVSVDLNLTKKDGRIVWAAKDLSDFEAYLVEADTERTDANRRNAIRVLSKRIAERTVNRFSDDF